MKNMVRLVAVIAPLVIGASSLANAIELHLQAQRENTGIRGRSSTVTTVQEASGDVGEKTNPQTRSARGIVAGNLNSMMANANRNTNTTSSSTVKQDFKDFMSKLFGQKNKTQWYACPN